jgi:hypothetical protein
MFFVSITFDETTVLGPGEREYLTPRRPAGTRIRRAPRKATADVAT